MEISEYPRTDTQQGPGEPEKEAVWERKDSRWGPQHQEVPLWLPQIALADNKPLSRFSGWKLRCVFLNFLMIQCVERVVLLLAFSGLNWDKPGLTGSLSMEPFILGFLMAWWSRVPWGPTLGASAYLLVTCSWCPISQIKSLWLSLSVGGHYRIPGSHFFGGH